MDETVDLGEFFDLQRATGECTVAAAIEELAGHDEAAHRKLLAALATPGDKIKPGTIGKWLEDFGLEVTATAVGNHRANRCYCRSAGARG